MTVSFYTFSKKRNSTKIPSGSGTDIDVNLKEDTSLYHPTFHLTGNYPAFTYAKWQGMYYYVNDIISVGNGRYEIECDLDPMATERSNILSTTAFVVRSASAYDNLVPDPEICRKADVIDMETGSTPLSSYFDGTGCYVMRTVGGTSSTGINTYIHSKASLAQTLGFIWSNDVLDAAWDTVIKAIFNPFQYIISLKYSPLSYNFLKNAGSTSQTAYYGWWADSHYTYPSPSYNHLHISAFTIDKPVRYYNDWRDYDSRFTRAYIILPGGELHVIPSAWLSQSLKLDFYFDIINGEGAYRLWSDGYILASFNAKLLFDFQIGQVDSTLPAVSSGSVGMIAAASTGNLLATSIMAAGTVSDSVQPNPSINGTSVGVAGYGANKNVRIVAEYYDSTDYPVNMGRMLNDNRTLSTLTGYCQCANASVSSDLPAMYKEEINSMVNSGFYIE